MTRHASPKAQSRRSSVRTASPTRHQQAGGDLAYAAKRLGEQMRGAKEEGSDDEAMDGNHSAVAAAPLTGSAAALPKPAPEPNVTAKAPAKVTIVVGREGVSFPSSLATQDHDVPGPASQTGPQPASQVVQETAADATAETSDQVRNSVGDEGNDVDNASPRGATPGGQGAGRIDELMLDEMADEYEDEGLLEHDHPEAEWQLLETRFAQCNVMIAFSLTDATVAVPGKGYMGIQDMAGWIIKLLGARGISFGCDGLHATGGQAPLLLGRPSQLNRKLWIALRRGYIKVLGVTVWMQPAYTGKRASNLSLLELEYSNPNFMSAKAIHAVLRRWGATEALVISHGRGNIRKCKWPAIECVTNAVRNPATDEYAYTFRLFLESEDIANGVYAASMKSDRDELADIL